MCHIYPSSNRYQFYFNICNTYCFKWMIKLIKKTANPLKSLFSGRLFYPEIYLLHNFVTNSAITLYYTKKISTKNSFNNLTIMNPNMKNFYIGLFIDSCKLFANYHQLALRASIVGVTVCSMFRCSQCFGAVSVQVRLIFEVPQGLSLAGTFNDSIRSLLFVFQYIVPDAGMR